MGNSINMGNTWKYHRKQKKLYSKTIQMWDIVTRQINGELWQKKHAESTGRKIWQWTGRSWHISQVHKTTMDG